MSAGTGRRFLRAGLLLALAGLVLGVVGDHRGVTAAVSRGIDPLEILNLQVKPNVIVVLDSSGSMSDNLTSGSVTGDYARSKLALAKDVLNRVVTDNANDVNFLFGQYNQGTTSMANTGAAANRFFYAATSYEYPNMVSLEVSLRREPGTESSFNISAGVNDTITFFERVGSATASPRTYFVCSFVIPAGSYVGDADMVTLAATIQTRFTQPYPNADVTCTKVGNSTVSAPQNSYAFTWDTVNQRFRIGRSGGTSRYQLRFGTGTTASAGPALGFSTHLPLVGGTPVSTPVPPTVATSTQMADTNWSNVTSAAPYSGTALGLIGVSTRGFEAWRDIRSTWNTFYFREGGQNCSFTIDTPPSPPGIYVKGADLALQMQNKMNGVSPNPNPCSSLSPRNVYAVTYDGPNGQFRFRRVTSNQAASLQWGSQTANSVRAALNAQSGGAFNDWDFSNNSTNCPAGVAANTFCTRQIPLLRRFTGNDPLGGASFSFAETYDPDGTGPQSAQSITTYLLRAGKFFNGEIFQVTGSGGLCSMRTGPTQVPPVVTLEQVDTCGGTVENTVVFKWAGADFGGGACGGFAARVPLATCDQVGSIQLSAIQPFIARQNIFNPDGTMIGYEEDASAGFAGGFRVRPGASYNATNVGGSTLTGGIRATGFTPIANSLLDIRTKFVDLWNNGQATPLLPPISVHVDPKERTIVIFVTDGDDTCDSYDGDGGGATDDNALRAAYKAQLLYQRIDALDPASSVTTYVVGFGLSSSKLNWIAWGGSGMTWTTSNGPDASPSFLMQWASPGPTQAQKDAQCPTCIDAFVAPTPERLSEIIQSIINQGAQFGDFTAQASLVEPVYEYSAEVPTTGLAYSPFNGAGSKSRYEGLVPVLFWTTFSMPDFQGHFYGITADAGGVAVTRWDAGERLLTLVKGDPIANAGGMAECDDNGTNSDQCTFSAMSDSVTANGEIPRHIYTTSRNGVFPVTIGNLTDLTWLQTNGNRTSLWPPSSTVNPASPTVGLLDAALGLPMADDDAAWDALTTDFQACLGSGAPANCAGSNAVRVPQARKEAREMILAYMAGAKVVPDVNTAEPLRTGGAILYRARSWILAESTMATSAVVAPPMQSTPTGVYDPEYVNYRDGPRTTTSTPAPTDGLKLGFGLRNPDLVGGTDVTSTLNPVMTVTYVAANDMLHAFRAGPNTGSGSSACTKLATVDCGGEELWGFVPYDQLAKLRDLMLPQTRNDHAFVMAAPVRFSDVFVPAPGTTSNPSGATFSTSVGGASVTGQGVWRKLVIVGRGIAGKHLTALDVTAPGPFTGLAKDAIGPIPYWSRGNPDTVDGLSGGGLNNDTADRDAYAKMGETWSVPAIGYVNRLNSARKGCGGTPGVVCTNPTGGVEFVAFAGSGYGEAGEGTTFYTLDLLTGDVVASADVGSASSPPLYANALVANPAAYAANQFNFKGAGHPFSATHKTSRVYIGDLHGRLWKFVTSALTTPVLFADFGVNQPLGTPVALLKLPADDTGKPYIFANTGQDSRADPAVSGQFRYFALRDDTSDGDTTPPATAQSCTPAVQLPCIFTDELKGTAQFGSDFRGTVQPATVMAQTPSGSLAGRVFFGGTRFIPPPPKSPLSTPVPPYPCRSRFDSIVFALGAETGGAGFDLNDGGVDDRYMILDNAKIVALSIIIDPVAGGSRPHIDDGLRKPNITPTPPEMGPRPVLGSSVSVPPGSTITGSTVCK